jgi:YQGE family putative transporter
MIFVNLGNSKTMNNHHNFWSSSVHKPQGSGSKGKLDKQTILLLGLSVLYVTAGALSGTFVGVYLWKAHSDYRILASFQGIGYVSVAAVFWLAGGLVKGHGKMQCLRTGVALSAVFYLVVLLLGAHAVNWYWLLGLLQGTASGLYWLSYNVIYFEVTDKDNRDRVNGWVGLLASGSGMIAPWISGRLIQGLGGPAGYRLIFSLSLGIYGLGVLVSFFLKKRPAQGPYDWRFPIRALWKRGGEWQRIGLAAGAQGVREGVFMFLIGLLVYVQTGSEAKLGDFTLFTSAVALAAFWLTGRLVKPIYRYAGMGIGSVMLALSVVPLFWGVSYFTLLIFGVVSSLFFPIYMIPYTTTIYDSIGQNEQTARQRVELVVMRELALNTGRLSSVLLLLLVLCWSSAANVLTVLLFVVGSFPVLSWYLLRDRLKVR